MKAAQLMLFSVPQEHEQWSTQEQRRMTKDEIVQTRKGLSGG